MVVVIINTNHTVGIFYQEMNTCTQGEKKKRWTKIFLKTHQFIHELARELRHN